MTKFHNKKVEVDGHKFDSQAEARRYSELLLLQRAGDISNLELQPPFILAESVIINGRKKPALKYIADFSYIDKDGNEVIEDVKGHLTKEYIIKRHLMKSVFGIDIKEVK